MGLETAVCASVARRRHNRWYCSTDESDNETQPEHCHPSHVCSLSSPYDTMDSSHLGARAVDSAVGARVNDSRPQRVVQSVVEHGEQAPKSQTGVTNLGSKITNKTDSGIIRTLQFVATSAQPRLLVSLVVLVSTPVLSRRRLSQQVHIIPTRYAKCLRYTTF